MEELECKLNELESMLREDGYNASNIVIQTLSEAQEQVKNIAYEPVLAVVTDEEIQEHAEDIFEPYHVETQYNNPEGTDAYIEGAKWMRNKLMGNNR